VVSCPLRVDGLTRGLARRMRHGPGTLPVKGSVSWSCAPRG
jgi:hypothetical protein